MSNRRTNPMDELEARLSRPLKVALFGHRNVGKTTLLAMFYRQASSGQVPGLAAGGGRRRRAPSTWPRRSHRSSRVSRRPARSPRPS